jgi:hypothetical protein
MWRPRRGFATNRGDAVERREAQPPTSLGVRAFKRRVRVTGLDRGARAGPPQGSPEGAPAAPLAELYGGFAKGCLVSIPWGLASSLNLN